MCPKIGLGVRTTSSVVQKWESNSATVKTIVAIVLRLFGSNNKHADTALPWGKQGYQRLYRYLTRI